MQTVILCGGTGTRLREQTEFIPKPLVPIGGKPLIWHIMMIYSHYGFDDFVLPLGYKQEAFKHYFANFHYINSDMLSVLGGLKNTVVTSSALPYWRVVLSDTGADTMKGGRIKRVQRYILGDDFLCTYGDGVGDIDIGKLVAFHKAHGKIATVTGVYPRPRFGDLHCDGNSVTSFTEKVTAGCLVSGGFFVFKRAILDHLSESEHCDLEVGVLDKLAVAGELMVYRHEGWWGCVDTIKEMNELDHLWVTGKAPWKIWK